MGTLYPGIRRIVKGAPEGLGQTDPKNLGGGFPDLPEMLRTDESNKCDRGSGRHQRDPKTPGIMGGETPFSTPKRQIAAFINRAPYRLFGLAGLPFPLWAF